MNAVQQGLEKPTDELEEKAMSAVRSMPVGSKITMDYPNADGEIPAGYQGTKPGVKYKAVFEKVGVDEFGDDVWNKTFYANGKARYETPELNEYYIHRLSLEHIKGGQPVGSISFDADGVKKSINKSDFYDEIEEVEKFNPFHDAQGKFSNKMGFKTYSANPKTRAGAMAITRSNNAGHGRTLNVHRESKGESIKQNANWLATGQKPAVPAAVSRARYQQRKQKLQQQQQQQNQSTAQNAQGSPTTAPKTQASTNTTQQQKPAQSKPQKPTAPKNDTATSQTVSNGKAANAVNGKDLAGKFQFNDNSSDYSIEQVIKAQGFDGKPTVTKDAAAFSAACKASNFIAKRGIGASDQRTMDAYDKALKEGDFYVKCSGGSAHGYGMYAASTTVTGSRASSNLSHAERTARSYAGGSSAKKVYTMTLDRSAKIGTEDSLTRQMRSDTEFIKMCQKSSMRSYYTQDVGVYAAYKGYDAYVAGRGRNSTASDYTVILNRSKVIILDT